MINSVATPLYDLLLAITSGDTDLNDLKITVGNTDLYIIKRSVNGFPSAQSVQYRIVNTDHEETTVDWTTTGVKERYVGGGKSSYFVYLVLDESSDSVQFDIDWNVVGTNKYATESINLTDLFPQKAIPGA